MHTSFRVKTLVVMVAASLGVAAVPVAWSVAGGPGIPTSLPTPEQASQEVTNYFVYFNEPGALHYEGGVDGMERTAAAGNGEKFEANRSEVVAYRSHLKQLQDERIAQFEAVLGRPIVVEYRYDLTNNGITVRMSGAEAAKLATQPSVRKVEKVPEYRLDTDRGPQFIGADQIWSGFATPSGSGNRGSGTVIGVFDSGVNASHPSFSNDASCGFSAEKPKLIAAKDCVGSSSCAGPDPFDSNGHGSHTASTAGGNQHIATGGQFAGLQISGVAPCAQVITYKVCPGSSCDGAAIQAAIQTAIVDKVDVVNFSISGGTSPWTDNDRGFLDLVNNGTVVAASAGNTRTAPQTPTQPIGEVNHRGPWVMTVANSTHDRISKNAVSVAGGPQDRYGLKSAAPFTMDLNAQIADSTALGNQLGCTAGGAFPVGSMTGKIALISRGSCPFEEKINNAVAAGAIGVVVHNNTLAPPILMGLGTATTVPSVMVGLSDGQAIRTFVQANPTAVGSVDSDTVRGLDPLVGDVLNSSSLRGPIAGGIEVTKPDITAPGTNIFAAYFGAANSYEFLTGTSMSGPHTAGSAALVMGVHPSWTPMEVKSAMQLTAKKTGSKDFTFGTPNNGQWDADDVGNGRVAMNRAALAGLVLNETYANFLAANGNVINQRALNLPSMRNTLCTPNCTFTRTVRNTLPGASNWTTAGVAITSGGMVTVSPASFSFTGAGIPNADTLFANGFDTPVPAETQVLTITVTTPAASTAMAFGEVNLTETGSRSPSLHMTTAAKKPAVIPPGVVTLQSDSFSGSGSFNLLGSPTAAPPLQFAWLNRFTPSVASFPFTLNSIQTVFAGAVGSTPPRNGTELGELFDFYVYQDNDTNPANGATLLGSVVGVPVTVQNAVQTVTIPGGLAITAVGGGDILIGIVNRGRLGYFPASADLGPDQDRSWISSINTVQPGAPVLATSGLTRTTAVLPTFTFNWIIRGNGTTPAGAPVSLEN